MQSKYVRMYQGHEVFQKAREMFGKDIEGEINTIYDPPCTGAYCVYIPKRKHMTEDGYSDCQLKLFEVLLDEPDLVPGDTIWIEVDY